MIPRHTALIIQLDTAVFLRNTLDPSHDPVDPTATLLSIIIIILLGSPPVLL